MNNSILNNKIALIEYVSNCEELSRNIKYKGLYGQNAWEYAVESLKSIPDFNLLDDDTKLDRLIVEALFFNIVYYTYEDAALSEDIAEPKPISLEKYRNFLGETMFNYLSCIHDIFKYQFESCRKCMNSNSNSINYNFNTMQQIYTPEYIKTIQECAQKAINIYPNGEHANRILFLTYLIQLEYYPNTDFSDFYEFIQKLPCGSEDDYIWYPDSDNLYAENPVSFIRNCNDCCYVCSQSKLFQIFGGIHNFPFYDSNDYTTIKIDDEEQLFNTFFLFPLLINIKTNVIELLDETLKKNEELKKEKEEKIELINDFSHKYGKHKASNLKDIAEYLLNIDNEDVRYYGRLALYEISRKNNMDKDVEILKDAYSETHEFREKIKASTKHIKDGSNLEEHIIEETIKSCLITLLYDKTAKGRSLRNKVFKKENPEEIEDILYDYEKKVIVDGKNSLLWLKEQQIIDIQFDIGGEWKNLYFEEGEYSAIVITDILSELVFNALKYAEQNKPISISFSSDDIFITITEKNSISNIINSNSGKGIKSCNTLLKRFHKPLNMNFEPVTIVNDGDTFKEEIRLAKKLFREE